MVVIWCYVCNEKRNSGHFGNHVTDADHREDYNRSLKELNEESKHAVEQYDLMWFEQFRNGQYRDYDPFNIRKDSEQQPQNTFNPVDSRPPQQQGPPLQQQQQQQPPQYQPQQQQQQSNNDHLMFPPNDGQQQQQHAGGGGDIPHGDLLALYQQPPPSDSNNHFAAYMPQQQHLQPQYGGYPPPQQQQFGGYPPQQRPPQQFGYPQSSNYGYTANSMMAAPTTSSNNGSFRAFDPFANASAGHYNANQSKPDIDSTISNLVNNMEIAGKNPAWMTHPPAGGIPPPGSNQSFGNGAVGNPWPSQPQAPPYGYPPQQQQPSASSNPYGAPASSQQQSNEFGS